jgi:hypothetical protein
MLTNLTAAISRHATAALLVAALAATASLGACAMPNEGGFEDSGGGSSSSGGY